MATGPFSKNWVTSVPSKVYRHNGRPNKRDNRIRGPASGVSVGRGGWITSALGDFRSSTNLVLHISILYTDYASKKKTVIKNENDNRLETFFLFFFTR